MFLLILLSIFHAVNNYIVLKLDTLPPLCDGLGFFLLSRRVLTAISEHRIPPMAEHFPPFLSYITALIMLLFGKDPFYAHITVSLFLTILIFSTYGIGKLLFGRTAGIISAFVVSTFPIVFGYSRINWLPVPTAAMTALSVLLLLRTERLQNKRYAFLSGITSGLALLTNWTFIIYFSAPFMFYLLSAWKHTAEGYPSKSSARRSIVINTALIVLLAVLISACWYIRYFFPLFNWKFGIAFNNPFNNNPGINLISAVTGYLKALLNYAMRPFYILLFIPAFIIFIARKNKEKAILLLWLAIPAALFIFAPPPEGSAFKTNRFLIPALAPAALIIAALIPAVRNRKLQIILISIIASGGLLQFFLLTYVIREPINYFPHLPPPKIEKYSWQIRFERGLLYPFSKTWGIEEIINTISAQKNTGTTRILVMQSVPPVQNALQLYSYEKPSAHLLIMCPAEELDSGDPNLNYNFKGVIEHASFILDLAPGYNKDFFNLTPIIPLMNEFSRQISEFTLIKILSLPENLTLNIYRKRDKSGPA